MSCRRAYHTTSWVAKTVTSPAAVLRCMAEVLPVDVWAEVFRCLQLPDPRLVHGVPTPVPANFWQLPVVCKIFQNVFSKHSGLASRISITQQPSPSSLSSLLPWLHAHAKDFQSFEVSCQPAAVSRCLTALAQPSCSLTSLHLGLKGWSFFSRRGRQALGARLDLAPVQGLRHLFSLTLEEGVFMNLSAASALTHLEIVNADATSNCECCNFVSSLVKLRMISSYLSGLHAGGLRACSALQELHLYGSCAITTDTPDDRIYHNTMDFYTAMPFRV